MINLRERCSRESCVTPANCNFEGIKRAVFCKDYVEGGMVNALCRRCSHEACTQPASHKVKGIRKALFCPELAEEGMVHVFKKKTLLKRGLQDEDDILPGGR